MTTRLLLRVYRIRGLDRVLYATAPTWPEGTFRNLDESEGELTLVKDGVGTPDALDQAKTLLDAQAERFRLAIALRIGCPLEMELLRSEDPDVYPPGVLHAVARVRVTGHASATVLPGAPPPALPQLPQSAARWVRTYTETRKFGGFPDEVLKRFYLIIEELWPVYGAHATTVQKQDEREILWLRHFVSHAQCRGSEVCTFIGRLLPSAIVATSPMTVRFDRTSVEHRNFIGRFEPKARDLARWLMDTAITAGSAVP
jgi:hypothetical protein